MIDTHAHLDGCDEEPGELLARAAAAGVTRVVTVGTGIDSCRRALAIAEANPGVSAALGIDPHRAATDDAGARRRAQSSCSSTLAPSQSARRAWTATTAGRPCGSSARCSTPSSRSPTSSVGRS